MDQKDRDEIRNRSEIYGRNSRLYQYKPYVENAYIQGALDQDPISRKVMYNKIMDCLLNRLDYYKNSLASDIEINVFKDVIETVRINE